MKKPNVVIIMADQLRPDVLGDKYTPHLNRLAEESVVFNRAYCASPLCVPARGAFFTGTYPNVNGSIINPWEPLDKKHGDVRCGIPNLYDMMEKDWDSWHSGKQHLYTEGGKMEESSESETHWITTDKTYNALLKENGKRKPGGDRYRGIVPEMALGKVTRMKRYSIPTTGCYPESFDYFFDGHFAHGAVEAIRSRNRDRPFLLNAMFLAPHPPLEIPEPWYSRVEDIDLPENVGKWCSDQSPLQLYNLTGALGNHYSREDWKEVWRVYMGLVSLLDDCVGMIIDELKAQGMYEDTLIIFTSDHGEMLGSHCLWQKMCMYEESAHTPLYIKFPKKFAPAVKESDELVSAVDIVPTLCDYLKIERPERLSGLSLMPVAQGQKLDRKSIYIQFDGNGARSNFQRCVLSGEYKLIADIFKDELYLELYNVMEDPQELNNRAFEPVHQSKIEEMLEDLRTHMIETGDLLNIPEDTYQKFMDKYSLFHK